MGLLDKFKDATNKATEKANEFTKSAKEEYARAKEEKERKQAAKDAYKAEMEEKALIAAEELIEKILDNRNSKLPSIFSSINESQLQSFTKEFYEKMVLPGSKASLSCILMYPYIDEKKIKNIKNAMKEYDDTEIPLLYIADSEKQEFLLTTDTFYFKVRFIEDRAFWCKGKISTSNINSFHVESSDAVSSFMVNGKSIATIKICNTYLQDFMALNEYCRSIIEKDFDIEPKEIDRLIQQKIGSKIYQHIKKYMVYDDELVMYYAGGSDSLLALDYIACTTRQIIIVNREVFGATANVKQFYYEDITSMATEQNSKSDDLLVFIIDTALTAAFKICNLVITVAGSVNRINTLYTVEAERIVAIYHQYRKEAKTSTQTIQNIVQQQEPDVMDQLMKLAQLKDSGIITEDEFNQKREQLLAKI